MCVIPTEKIRRRMRGGFDYYAAPNCSKLCSSGSGTPKANGTQECSCADTTQMILTAGSYTQKFWGTSYGFAANYGNLSNNTYRGSTITSFFTTGAESLTIGGVSVSTQIKFADAPNDASDINVKINSKVYTFKRASSTVWGCSEKIFTSTGTYQIEFLN